MEAVARERDAIAAKLADPAIYEAPTADFAALAIRKAELDQNLNPPNLPGSKRRKRSKPKMTALKLRHASTQDQTPATVSRIVNLINDAYRWSEAELWGDHKERTMLGNYALINPE